ncbi:Adenylate cyclase [hydrothermal vent metagenome]|uniref:Adenylate cyclase n=1 Tax=hydrothermal vent metagenome TaxID=652676 RepID=A0A3B0XI00_9ZZZZ
MKELIKTEERNLHRWCLIKEFRKKLSKELPNHRQSDAEKDPRRKMDYLDYSSAILFTLFNPVIKSMRGLCAATELTKVKEHVTMGQINLATFSEAQHVFDSEVLHSLVQKLSAKVSFEQNENAKLLKAVKDLVAVDGSLFQTLTRVLWAEWVDDKNKAAKLHLGFSLLKNSAVDALITDGNTCERKTLLKMIEPGVMYVCDRGYGLDYRYFEKLTERGALFTIRIRNKPIIEVIQEYEISEQDRKEGVLSDQLVYLGKTRRNLPPVRLVKTGAFENKEIFLVTSEPPEKLNASLISTIYRMRWQIEVFFKWLKSILGCRKLLAESSNGVAIQIYCALIAAILLFDFLGKKPTLRQMEMLQFYFLGYASAEEIDKAIQEKKNKK